MFYELYYIIFGASILLFFYNLFKKDPLSNTPSFLTYLTNLPYEKAGKVKLKAHPSTNNKIIYKKMFFNMFFMDRKEVIRNIVRSKVPRSRPLVRALSKRAAVVVLENSIVQRVGETLCSGIIEKLALLGLKATPVICYTQCAYLCIEVNIENFDFETFFIFKVGEEKGKKIAGIINTYIKPIVPFYEYLKKFFINLLCSALFTKLPSSIKQKLYNTLAAEVEIIPCKEEDQGAFLTSTIMTLNNSAKTQNSTVSSSIAPTSTVETIN